MPMAVGRGDDGLRREIPPSSAAPERAAITLAGRWQWPTGDVLLSRGLRYGLLAAYIGGLYLIVATRGGVAYGVAEQSLWFALVALVLVAVTIVPVHNWLRRGLDHLIYDWHDDPYAAITDFTEHLNPAQSQATGEVIPAIVATVAATLKLPYVAIETDGTDGARTTIHGIRPPLAELLTIPLAYQGTEIGVLHASARRSGETLSANDQRLLRDLARQVGITLHADRLSAALQASREGLVSAREEERRRIRRDLHDSLAPTLASLRMQLGAVRRTLREEPSEAEAMIDGLREDVRDATAAIRRLVYGLRPPLLDEHGLDGALRGLGSVAAPATLILELPEPLPPLSAAVEVALYRIASEAVHNVAKHAQATACTVRLEQGDETLTLTIRDDGVGLLDACIGGIGLPSMRERAAELGGRLAVAAAAGGGTTVVASIPRRPSG